MGGVHEVWRILKWHLLALVGKRLFTKAVYVFSGYGVGDYLYFGEMPIVYTVKLTLSALTTQHFLCTENKN